MFHKFFILIMMIMSSLHAMERIDKVKHSHIRKLTSLEPKKNAEILISLSEAEQKSVLNNESNRLIISIYNYFLKQSRDEVKAINMLKMMDEKPLKILFSELGPQSQSHMLALLPEEKKGIFKAQIKQDQEIREKYKYEDFKDPYSVNLMWIFKEDMSKSDLKYIFPTDKTEAFIENILAWAAINDTVNVWYDGTLVSDEMINNTKEALTGAGNVYLKDIRELKLVQENAHVFNMHKELKEEKSYVHDHGSFLAVPSKTGYLPVSFRAQLTRAILLYEIAKKGHIGVYSNLNMKPPMSKESYLILIRYTDYIPMVWSWLIIYLIVYFIVIFLDSFQMVSPQPNLLQAMETALIHNNIKRATSAINNGYCEGYDQDKFDEFLEPLEDILHDSYHGLFNLFYGLQGWGDLVYQEKPYTLETHGDDPSVTMNDQGRGDLLIYQEKPYTLKTHGGDPFVTMNDLGEPRSWNFNLKNKKEIIKYPFDLEIEKILYPSRDEKGEYISSFLFYPTKEVDRAATTLN